MSFCNLLNLEMSERTIRRYLNALGWKKVRAKYCQIVTLKNLRERITYVYAARHVNHLFIMFRIIFNPANINCSLANSWSTVNRFLIILSSC